MPVIERDVVLTGMEGGHPTMDFPFTKLANVEDTANVKPEPEAGDYFAVMDSADRGQMKKAPLSAILNPLAAAQAPRVGELTVQLPAAGWSGGAQTVHNDALEAQGYGYIIAPDSASYGLYTACMVRAEDVVQDGEITFLCGEVPAGDLTVNLMKIEVKEDGHSL